MWAAAGHGLDMKALWTDTPYAMERVFGLYEAQEITAQERHQRQARLAGQVDREGRRRRADVCC